MVVPLSENKDPGKEGQNFSLCGWFFSKIGKVQDLLILMRLRPIRNIILHH